MPPWPLWLRQIAALARYCLKLWKRNTMPLTIESLTPGDIAALERQSDVDGIPLDQWIRNRLLSGVSATVRGQVNPQLGSALTSAALGLDAVDQFFEDDGGDPSGTSTEGGSTVFGLLPVTGGAQSAASEAHARTKGSGQAAGPIATVERVDGHPCAHLERRYLANFTANDCQGTCGSPRRGESVCTWAAGSASNCAYFQPKRRPVPMQPTLPRQG